MKNAFSTEKKRLAEQIGTHCEGLQKWMELNMTKPLQSGAQSIKRKLTADVFWHQLAKGLQVLLVKL